MVKCSFELYINKPDSTFETFCSFQRGYDYYEMAILLQTNVHMEVSYLSNMFEGRKKKKVGWGLLKKIGGGGELVVAVCISFI